MKAEIEIKRSMDIRKPEPGIYEGISFKRYCKIPAVNQSTLKEILKSPKHYRAATEKAEQDTPAMRDGRIIHSLVLEPRSVSSRVAIWPEERRAGLVWEAVEWIWQGEFTNAPARLERMVEKFRTFSGEARRGKEWKTFKAEFDADAENADKKILTAPEMAAAWEFIKANDSGRTPFETRELVTQAEWDRLKEIADAMREHPLSGPLKIRKSDKGNAWRELTLIWIENTDAGDVLCKARLDLVRLAEEGSPLPVVRDLKKTATDSEREFAGTVRRYGYDFQREWYCRGWDKLTGQWLPASNFRFVTVGALAPHDVNDYALPEVALHAGKYHVERALDRLAECRASDTWPGENADEPKTLDFYYPSLPAGVDLLDLAAGKDLEETPAVTRGAEAGIAV